MCVLVRLNVHTIRLITYIPLVLLIFYADRTLARAGHAVRRCGERTSLPTSHLGRMLLDTSCLILSRDVVGAEAASLEEGD